MLHVTASGRGFRDRVPSAPREARGVAHFRPLRNFAGGDAETSYSYGTKRVTPRAVVMAAPEPGLAAPSPAALPEQQEGAVDCADPAPDSVSSAAPELPGRPAASDAALQAEATPRPGASRPGPETFRQRFRQFRYQDAAGPREAFRQLRELSRQWLRPDIRTKEQIVEMLVQEQLQAILPEAAPVRRLRRRADVRITG